MAEQTEAEVEQVQIVIDVGVTVLEPSSRC